MNSPKNTSPKKPSPLGYGSSSSPRTSPFKRTGSPSPAPQTPPPPSTQQGISPSTPQSSLRHEAPAPVPAPSPTHTPRPLPHPGASATASPFRHSPTRTPPTSANVDATSKLHPAQMREMRECFQLLDRDGDGTVNEGDVSDMLEQLGLASARGCTQPYFAHGGVVNMAWYLGALAGGVAGASSPGELAAAFSAFDADDSGQVDVGELREALLDQVNAGGSRLDEGEMEGVIGEFRGRRAFGRGAGMGLGGGGGGGAKGDVFRYREFIGAVTGGGGAMGRERAEEQQQQEVGA